METDVVIVHEDEWGATLTPQQRQAARIVVDDVVARSDVLGIVLAGSIVRGEGGPTSDLDLYVVISSPCRQRRQLLVMGVRVEVFINPPWIIRSYFADELREGSPSTAHMLATGIPLFERGATLSELRDEARRLLADGPAALSEGELTQRRYDVIDLAEDADDVRAGNPDALAYVLPLLVQRAISLLYARQRRWTPKPKRLPGDLERVDPDAAALLRAYLREPDLSRRHALVGALVDRAIAPLPRAFFIWDSEPEEMPPA